MPSHLYRDWAQSSKAAARAAHPGLQDYEHLNYSRQSYPVILSVYVWQVVIAHNYSSHTNKYSKMCSPATWIAHFSFARVWQWLEDAPPTASPGRFYWIFSAAAPLLPIFALGCAAATRHPLKKSYELLYDSPVGHKSVSCKSVKSVKSVSSVIFRGYIGFCKMGDFCIFVYHE